MLAACAGSSSSPASQQGDASGAVPDGAALQDAAPVENDACTVPGFDASAYTLADGAAPVIGSPCLPSSEMLAGFHGFDSHEIIGIVTSTVSGAPVCVAYYFEGLVTCPYGQSADAQAPSCPGPCTTTEGQPIAGDVPPQCEERPASEYVFWTCRCANLQGATSDGYAYCTCPAATTCTQTISSLGAAEDDYSGAYCIPVGLMHAGACASVCNPATTPCN
jgi:hypothetical protein